MMKKITLEHPESKSADLIAENIEKLKSLFPELVTEGPNGASINIDVLKQLVGDQTVTDCDEKYGLNWFGKRRARQLALTPSTGTLRPAPEESENWDTTQNIFIEGDNLEVLKLLQKSYAGKIKMIYIDPPYNTGKDFIYKDDFRDNIRNYKRLTGQVDEEGSPLTSNPETSGRFHTDWLNMMYPRLKLARNLLREDGVIFISIDDNEVSNLRKLCDEIFGEENFVSQFTIRSNPRGSQASKHIAVEHEFILAYARNYEFVTIPGYAKTEEDSSYNFVDKRGRYRLLGLRQRGGAWRREDRPDMYYPIFVNPNDGTVSLEESDIYYKKVLPQRPSGEDGRWTWGKKKLEENKNLIVGKKVARNGLNDFWDIFRKDYLYDESGNITRKKPRSLFDEKEVNYQNGRNEIKQLFGNSEIFDFPKPSFLIQKCIGMLDNNDNIILDLFAGSCTTAHAVMKLNAEDGGNRRFIMVQLPEPVNEKSEAFKAGFKTIAEIGKERLRRAAKKLKEEHPDWNGDTGFRVFKLDSSNIKAWNPQPEDLEHALLEHIEHILPDRTEADLLYEILLKLGLDLCVPIETREITGKTVYSIGGGVLMACLDKKITANDVEELGLGIVKWHKELNPAGDTTCVFRDSAFENDVAKTNLAAILEQNGLSHVRSL